MSRLQLNSVDPDDYYVPAVQGTLGALETAAKT